MHHQFQSHAGGIPSIVVFCSVSDAGAVCLVVRISLLKIDLTYFRDIGNSY